MLILGIVRRQPHSHAIDGLEHLLLRIVSPLSTAKRSYDDRPSLNLSSYSCGSRKRPSPTQCAPNLDSVMHVNMADVGVVSSDENEHLRHLEAVFQHLTFKG